MVLTLSLQIGASNTLFLPSIMLVQKRTVFAQPPILENLTILPEMSQPYSSDTAHSSV